MYFVRKHIWLFILLFSNVVFAQKAPGGAGTETENRFWYNLDETDYGNGDAISEILNQGYNANAMNQTTASRMPVFTTGSSALNGFGVAVLDGTNDFLRIPNNSDLNTSSLPQTEKHFTMVIRTGSDVTSRQMIYEEGGGTRGVNIYIYNGNLYFGGWNNNNDGIGSPWTFTSGSVSISANTAYILTHQLQGNSSSTGTIRGYVNGNLSTTAGNVGYLYSHGADIGWGAKNNATVYETGTSGGTGHYFKGDLVEFIHYNKALNNAELDLVWNYLSSKFDITLSSTDYHNKDTPANLDYDYQVFGIGSAADGSTSDDGQGSSYVRFSNPSNLNASEFLMAGHNNLQDTVLYTGLPSGIQEMLNLSWRVTHTGDVGNVDVMLEIDPSGLTGAVASDFFLLIDNIDNDFSDASIVSASSISGDYAVFSSVDFSDGDFFTFGSLKTNSSGILGPGGVGDLSEVRFWLDATEVADAVLDGSTVQYFTNVGGNSKQAYQTNTTQRPVLHADENSANFNGQPYMSFDGVDDDFTIDNDNDINIGLNTQYSYYMAFKTSTDITSRQVLYEQGGRSRGLNFYIFDGDLYVGVWNLPSDGLGGGWGFYSTNTSISANTEYILGVRFDGEATLNGTVNVTLNGLDLTPISGIGYFYSHSGAIGIGGKNNDTYYETGGSAGSGDNFQGDIAEFIIYSEDLNLTEHNLVQNYLSSKYDISIGSIDYFDQDFSANGDYDLKLAGIGQETGADFHTAGQGNGIVRIENPTDIEDGEYLVWAETNQLNCNSSNVPASLNNRMLKTFRITKTGDVGLVDLSIILSEIDHGTTLNARLIVDSDDDFSDASVFSPSSVSGDTLKFNAFSFNDGDFFTLASIDEFSDQSLTSTSWLGVNNDWTNSINWTNGVPTSLKRAILTTTGTSPIISSDQQVFSLTVQPGASFELNNTDTLDIFENFTYQGDFTADQSTIRIQGDCESRQVTIDADLEVYNLILDVNSTLEISGSSKVDLKGFLQILNGDLQTNGNLTLISDETETARILEIPSTSTILGDIEMQRYIDAGATNWRFLSSAVSGIDLEAFDDDFITSGIPGSDWPTWPTAASPWPSFYFYDESEPGAIDNGYVVPSSTSDVLAVGQGVWIWCGDTITGTQGFTIDHSGPVNQGDIDLPVSFTNSGSSDDGWSMVGNPYPCTIDWDDVDWDKSNINSAIYIWNPDMATYSSYVPGSSPGAGVGTNDGSNLIASSQAFWVQANGASPVLRVKESCKSDQDHMFIQKAQKSNFLRLSFGSNAQQDQVVVRQIYGATKDFDGQYDAWKILNTEVGIAQISVSNDLNQNFSVSSYATDTIFSISLNIKGNTYDLHTLSVEEFSGFNGCISIRDHKTGETYKLSDQFSIDISLDSADLHHRFTLEYKPSVVVQTENLTCDDSQDGLIALDKVYEPFYLNTPSDTIEVISDTLINNLGAGLYSVRSKNTSQACATSNVSFEIFRPDPIDFSVEQVLEDQNNMCSAKINIDPLNGVAPFTFFIDSLVVDQQVSELCAGIYSLRVEDALGCNATQVFKVLSGYSNNNVVSSNKNEIEIFPIPSLGELTVKTSSEFNVLVLKNILGQELKTYNLSKINNELSLTNLAKGEYLLEFKKENEMSVQKRIVVF